MPPALPVEQVRRSFRQLTTCANCGVRDNETDRHILGLDANQRGTSDEALIETVLITVWLHPECVQPWAVKLDRGSWLKLEWDGSTNIRPFMPFKDANQRSQSSKKFWYCIKPRRRPEHTRCMTCEKFELPEHRAHRLAIGYHSSRPWPGRLAPGELLDGH